MVRWASLKNRLLRPRSNGIEAPLRTEGTSPAFAGQLAGFPGGDVFAHIGPGNFQAVAQLVEIHGDDHGGCDFGVEMVGG